jgi:hypothetical protein
VTVVMAPRITDAPEAQGVREGDDGAVSGLRRNSRVLREKPSRWIEGLLSTSIVQLAGRQWHDKPRKSIPVDELPLF